MIKETLTQSQFTDALRADEYAKWSYGATVALYEYFNEFEEDIELDIVAIRCEYSEYDTLQEVYDNYSQEENSEELTEEDVREWLEDRTTVLEARTPNTDYSNGAKLGDYITSYVIAQF